MGFTLGVENAPAYYPIDGPAVIPTQWGCYCNCDTTLQPNSVQEQTTKPYGFLPLEEKWVCVDPAPGQNWIDIACFDSEGYTIKESTGFVDILDGRDYIFDFATETLRDVTAAPVMTSIIGPLLALGLLAAMVGMMVPAVKKGFS